MMQRLTPSVYVETGHEGCNTGFIVTGDGIVAHDIPMVASQAKAWGAEIAKHGTLRYIISGEPHADHVTGGCYLGGTLIAQEGAREQILKLTFEDYKAKTLKFHPGTPVDNNFFYRAPEITIKDNITLYTGKHIIKVLMMPGHTPWNIATYVPEEKIIFISDTLTGDVSVLDDCLMDEWIDSLKFIQTLDVDYIIPGHGPVQNKSYIPQFMKGLLSWLDPVKEALKKGWTLEEAMKNITMEKEFPDIQKRMPWKPDIVPANVATIYKYLVNKKAKI
jgi:cyclase